MPEIAGCGDAWASLKTRLGQLPRRQLHRPVPEPAPDAQDALFKLADRAAASNYRVAAIHDERGYRGRAAGAGAGSTIPACWTPTSR